MSRKDSAVEDIEKNGVCLLVGNPNVGKSSLFNRMTGLRRHTGNWTGKSVDCAVAKAKSRKGEPPLYLADLPGCYSLLPASPEEEESIKFICSMPVRTAVVVCEVSSLARNLLLAYQLRSMEQELEIILCINLIDEAQRKGWQVDAKRLEALTGFPVFLTSARTGKGVDALLSTLRACSSNSYCLKADALQSAGTYYKQSTSAVAGTVSRTSNATSDTHRRKSAWHEWLTGKVATATLGLLFLFLIFWLTIYGANGPSDLLTVIFARMGIFLGDLALWQHLPWGLRDCLIDGAFSTMTHVVAVMLPPMAIFFPLFTLMEDIGILPRVAFHTDACFRRCGTGGRQCLTMCMSCGCHSVGVMGCRIISHPQERATAILTSALVPCNGKFPTLLAVISAFFTLGTQATDKSFVNSLMGAGLLTIIIVFTVICTWISTLVIQKLIFGGEVSPFLMEIPPIRRPNVGQIAVRSFLDRTLHVLWRAVAVSAPMGIVIWLLGNVYFRGQSILLYITDIGDPLGWLLGVDGAVLIALLLSAVANELTLPTLLMIYGVKYSLSEDMLAISFSQHPVIAQWSVSTLLCFTALFLFHAPCATTLWTIKKETGKLRYVLGAIAVPTVIGITLCLLIQGISALHGVIAP